MDIKRLKKIKRELEEMRQSPRGRKSEEFESIAKKLGRSKEKGRGKEPTYTRDRDPSLSPPLSIPNHSADMKIGTALSIIDALLSDVDDWELYFQEQEK